MPSLAVILYYLAPYYPSPFVLFGNTSLLKYTGWKYTPGFTVCHCLQENRLGLLSLSKAVWPVSVAILVGLGRGGRFPGGELAVWDCKQGMSIHCF